jgi:hypothetical protein
MVMRVMHGQAGKDEARKMVKQIKADMAKHGESMRTQGQDM